MKMFPAEFSTNIDFDELVKERVTKIIEEMPELK
jgi:hypothetical protein